MYQKKKLSKYAATKRQTDIIKIYHIYGSDYQIYDLIKQHHVTADRDGKKLQFIIIKSNRIELFR
jgi:hypothetical protein